MTVQGRVLCQNRARHKFKQDSRATWCWVRLPSSVMAGLLDTCNLTWPTIWTCHLFFIIFLKKINFFYKIRIALVLILMHLLLLLHIYHSTSEPNTIVVLFSQPCSKGEWKKQLILAKKNFPRTRNNWRIFQLMD